MNNNMYEFSVAPVNEKFQKMCYNIITVFMYIDIIIAIVALLHDLCKTNVYKLEKKNRKVNGRWEEYDGYGVDYSKFPLGHGEKSVIMLLTLGFPLTRDEMMAIRWHMTAWELAFQSAEAKSNLNAAKEQCPLLTVLQAADGLASALLEVTK